MPGNAAPTASWATTRHPEAIEESLEAARLEPDRADWHYAAGLAYASVGRIDRAVESMRAALARDANHALARAALADLSRAPRAGGSAP